MVVCASLVCPFLRVLGTRSSLPPETHHEQANDGDLNLGKEPNYPYLNVGEHWSKNHHSSYRWNEEEAMERRVLLGTHTGTSLSVPLDSSSTERPGAQHPRASGARSARQSASVTSDVEVADNTVFVSA
jgi:hypothetical protein